MSKRVLSVTETAETLGVSRPTVYKMIQEGGFPAVKLRPGLSSLSSNLMSGYGHRVKRLFAPLTNPLSSKVSADQRSADTLPFTNRGVLRTKGN